ncbi:hypothetical protein ATANTOWER_008726 [Ataeniobius toweri]|uniref:Uncharacterized protein n=1 Tax=Ataeniobius toweri TaxID=208326 RepID=A0ABU7A558_9TELE|nr:hypothetical protein [Ataeniobius toweri]
MWLPPILPVFYVAPLPPPHNVTAPICSVSYLSSNSVSCLRSQKHGAFLNKYYRSQSQSSSIRTPFSAFFSSSNRKWYFSFRLMLPCSFSSNVSCYWDFSGVTLISRWLGFRSLDPITCPFFLLSSISFTHLNFVPPSYSLL